MLSGLAENELITGFFPGISGVVEKGPTCWDEGSAGDELGATGSVPEVQPAVKLINKTSNTVARATDRFRRLTFPSYHQTY
jgi:hypothetical protein